MRILICLLVLLNSASTSLAGSREIANSGLSASIKETQEWLVQCTSSKAKCWLEKRVTYSSPAGEQMGGVALAYDNVAKKPMFINIWAAKGLSLQSGLIIRFLDSVDVEGKWKIKPASEKVIRIPVMDCDEEACVSRVHPEIKTLDGSPLNLFNELTKRRFLWVSFSVGKQDFSYMVSISGINQALEEIKR